MSQPRECGRCAACKDRVCLWRAGMFEEEHRPDLLGARFFKKNQAVEVDIFVKPIKLPAAAIPCMDQLAQTMLVIIPQEERLIGPFHLVMEYVIKHRGYGAGAG